MELLQGTVRNELSYSELIIRSSRAYVEDYQLKMIKENHIEGLLKLSAYEEDNCGKYIYDITGMTTLEKEHEKSILDKIEVKKFLMELINIIYRVNNYMLDINCIVLDPRYIFCKDERFYFVYYPPLENSLVKSFHALTEYWVKSVDYDDYASVAFVCGLHKESMDDNYNLELLLEQYVEANIESEETISVLKDDVLWNRNQECEISQKDEGLWKDEVLDDKPQEKFTMVKNILRESSMGKYWTHRKKERWGDWDDLLSQEESSIIDRSNRIK